MLRIRLRRVGKKKQPHYRIVVADSHAPRDGAFLDQIGTYNPLVNPAVSKVDEGKALRWIANGAQPSEPVQRILKNLGVLEKVNQNAGNG